MESLLTKNTEPLKLFGLVKKLICFLMIFGHFHSHSALAFDQKHQPWDQFLKKFVIVTGSNSTVKYAEAKKDRGLLDSYLEQVRQVKSTDFKTWSDYQKKAFYINAYNAYTIDFILRNYPVKSIKDLGNIIRSPWKKKEFDLFGEKVSLDHIEHELARAQYAEPRFHFAFNCASVGCPMLRAEAWIAELLESQLDSATRLFLADSRRNRVNKTHKTLELSKIFSWYKDDFEKASGNIANFTAKYLTLDPQTLDDIRKGGYKIAYLDYDWGLNDEKQ